MFFQSKNFFFPPFSRKTTLKSFSASNFAWTSFVFTKASGSWEQRRTLFRFSYDFLKAPHFWGCGIAHRWWEVFEACWNCKIGWVWSWHFFICHLVCGFQICCCRWMNAVRTINAAQSDFIFLYFWQGFLLSKCRIIREAVKETLMLPFLHHNFQSFSRTNIPL